MKNIKRMLAVCWMSQHCEQPIRFAVSMASRYQAELTVVHVIDTLWQKGWNLPTVLIPEEHRKDVERIQAKLDFIIRNEATGNLKVRSAIREGDPAEEILKMIKEEKIDLVVLRAHGEGRLEQFMVGSSNDAIVRKMPCSILLLKN